MVSSSLVSAKVALLYILGTHEEQSSMERRVASSFKPGKPTNRHLEGKKCKLIRPISQFSNTPVLQRKNAIL